MKYKEFLRNKSATDVETGIKVEKLNSQLFDFQRDITRWALKRGRAAIFADCGLGKTPMQLEWANKIPGNVLILAPLAVAEQTVREGEKFNIKVDYHRSQKDVKGKITITNYEMLHKFNPAHYNGIVLDESSILKSYTGKFRNEIIESFQNTPFKLCCTATPAPNDFMELGNHAEFLGTSSRTEMLSMFFVHDGGETQKWRLKGHAESEFWRWLCSWAVMIRKPSDLGYENDGFILPELKIHERLVKVDKSHGTGETLFRMPAETLQARQKERKITIAERVKEAASIINGDGKPWIIWCNLNTESESATKAVKDSLEISGSHSHDYKTKNMIGFTKGNFRILVTKPKIAGFGMNWQHCSNVIFLGLSDSYEQYYQAIRRCWRFGQKKQVNCYIITAETEGAVVENIKRKEQDAQKMAEGMVKHMHKINEQNIKGAKKDKATYKTSSDKGAGWTTMLGDCIQQSKSIKSDSIHYTIFSPPFASLYTYSCSERDMSNCKSNEEFNTHFKYLVEELYRITMPGRLVSFHCMNLPTSKVRDGFIGIRDFRGEMIKLFEKQGFYFGSEVCIWKDPVVAVTRTKALGLLHKQLTKDSSKSRQGIPDYLVTMRKPGENPEPLAGELMYFAGVKETFKQTGRLSIDIWQRYASPVWMDINPSNTLQYRSARANKDERHICPLQLDVIERGLQLWSNPNDTVFSPFMGIGSEGHVAIKTGRQFLGIELKESYYNQAVKNLKKIETEVKNERLF